MAPSLTEVVAEPPSFDYEKAAKSIFPDGLKTSGQRDPNYDQLVPYDQFPQQIEGPTVWKAEDYQNNPERWTHHFSDEEIDELSGAADAFLSSGAPLTGITKDRFPLPVMTQFLESL